MDLRDPVDHPASLKGPEPSDGGYLVRPTKQPIDLVHDQMDAAYRGLLKLASEEPTDDPFAISRGHKMLKAAMFLQRAMRTIKPLIEALDKPHREMLQFEEMLADRARAAAETEDDDNEPAEPID